MRGESLIIGGIYEESLFGVGSGSGNDVHGWRMGAKRRGWLQGFTDPDAIPGKLHRCVLEERRRRVRLSDREQAQATPGRRARDNYLPVSEDGEPTAGGAEHQHGA